MVLDLRMVGNQVVALPCPELFIDVEPGSLQSAPFTTPPFNTVHIDDVFDALQAVERTKNGGVIPKS